MRTAAGSGSPRASRRRSTSTTSRARALGKAIPYGIYDVSRNAEDDADRDLLADAHADLTAALAPPSELLDLLHRLPHLVRPTNAPTSRT
jgi:hypothetical protein